MQCRMNRAVERFSRHTRLESFCESNLRMPSWPTSSSSRYNITDNIYYKNRFTAEQLPCPAWSAVCAQAPPALFCVSEMVFCSICCCMTFTLVIEGWGRAAASSGSMGTGVFGTMAIPAHPSTAVAMFSFHLCRMYYEIRKNEHTECPWEPSQASNPTPCRFCLPAIEDSPDGWQLLEYDIELFI